MIAAALLLAVQTAPQGTPQSPSIPAPTPAAPSPVLPPNWAVLPVLRWRMPPTYEPEMTRFVVEEVEAGRCTAAEHDGAATRLKVDLALLVSAAGNVRTIVPRAIGCSTVEQYTSGLISSVTRDNLQPTDEDAWYRTSVTFSWAP